MDRYNIRDTSPIQSPISNNEPKVPKSAFNESRIHLTNAIYGGILIADEFPTIPNQHVKLNYNLLLKTRNPLSRTCYSGARIYAQAFYNRVSDLWKGGERFTDKGRSGSITMNKPNLIREFSITDSDVETKYSTFTPLSPSNMLGIPAEFYDNSKPIECYKATPAIDDNKCNNSYNGSIDALPFVMYARLYRDYFANPNLLQDNKAIYPDDEDEFILPYECENASVLYADDPDLDLSNYELGVDGNGHVPSAESDLPLPLNYMFYRQFKGDYFTVSSPFQDLLRGTAPTLPLQSVLANIDWDDVFPLESTVITDGSMVGLGQTDSDNFIIARSSNGSIDSSHTPDIKKAFSKAKVEATLNGTVNLNDLRALETYTMFLERNARTNGDYDSLIEAHFGYDPHSKSRKAIMIGSGYTDITFSDVTSTVSTDSQPLGSQATKGVCAQGLDLGEFTCPDYGYVMVLYQIVPDTYYTQGIPRHLTEISQNDLYFPEFNNLAPQSVLNKELFVSGDPDIDEALFGWQERYSDKKSRQSIVTGLMSLNHDIADFDASAVMARRFENTPTLSNEFVTLSPKNIDMNVYSVTDEPPFDVSIACIVDNVAPMPYKSIPGGLSASA